MGRNRMYEKESGLDLTHLEKRRSPTSLIFGGFLRDGEERPKPFQRVKEERKDG